MRLSVWLTWKKAEIVPTRHRLVDACEPVHANHQRLSSKIVRLPGLIDEEKGARPSPCKRPWPVSPIFVAALPADRAIPLRPRGLPPLSPLFTTLAVHYESRDASDLYSAH